MLGMVVMAALVMVAASEKAAEGVSETVRAVVAAQEVLETVKAVR